MKLRRTAMLNVFKVLLMGCLLLFGSERVGFSASLDPDLRLFYGQMHRDCLSERYISSELVFAAFIEQDTLKVAEVLKKSEIISLVEKYVDPDLLKSQRKKIKKRYDKLNALLDLKGRGFSLQDMTNAYVATGLVFYRGIYYSGASYGLIPQKSWTRLSDSAWKLNLKFEQKNESFYFRRIGNSWFLTDRKWIQ